jgi:hypothetical protein
MAYTTPPTFSSGTTATASDAQILSDDIAYLKAQTDLAVFSGVRATRTTNQSIPAATDTDVTLTAEVWDQGGWIAVPATTATVPASAIPPGYTTVVLDIRVGVIFTGNAVGGRRAIISQNGTQIYIKGMDAPGTSGLMVDFTMLAPAVAGDTFTVQVWQNSGGTLTITSANMSLAVFRPLS